MRLNEEQLLHLLNVLQAAKEGTPVQYRRVSSFIEGGIKVPAAQWVDFSLTAEAGIEVSGFEYRIKPKVVRYRRYLYRVDGGYRMDIVNDTETARTPHAIEAACMFAHWIDTEWQEQEVGSN